MEKKYAGKYSSGSDAATTTPGAAHQLAGFVRHAFTRHSAPQSSKMRLS
jgi:hypothetical protein